MMRLNGKSLSLLELIIAIVIVGIIASFAIPGYLGVKQRAEGRGASTLLKLIHAAEKVYELESVDYIPCAGFGPCNTLLNLDLPEDEWTYNVACLGGCGNDFRATAVNDAGTCTYSITKDTDMTSTGGCVYHP